jgi:hypothetical protein
MTFNHCRADFILIQLKENSTPSTVKAITNLIIIFLEGAKILKLSF